MYICRPLSILETHGPIHLSAVARQFLWYRSRHFVLRISLLSYEYCYHHHYLSSTLLIPAAMARAGFKVQRDNDATSRPMGLRRSARNLSQKGADPPVKQEEQPTKTPATPKPKPGKKRVRVKEEEIKEEDEPPTKVAKKNAPSSPSSTPRVSKSIKTEKSSPSSKDDGDKKPGKSAAGKEADLRAKKLKSYAQFANQSPYPAFARPTPEECQRAYDVLSSLHGERQRPVKLAAPTDRAGCGDAPSVLDALVRTILSQNTSNKNSTRAKLDMDAVYGRGDSEARWESIAAGGAAKLEKAIARGGLGGVKSRVIMGILEQVKERYGTYSLDHLLRLEAEGDDEAAMRELISFKGVGPKTASCVLLFCVGRDSFAVDTHVHRLTGMLGWRPASASRDETFAHLDARIPDPLKYGLHVLFVTHGRECAECKAGGKVLGRCELRKAFRRGKGDGQGGEPDMDEIKEEGEGEGEDDEADLKSQAMDS
ncbi:DNA glycosylase [Hypoxylon rubiginosum]|uniref:DNA glycosylase n=1 Tax=Hypoxylon rubiginosum TaxID=110542 RepID=A0ACC0DJJ2_9PEZI|nr:DNA glycosylase [Hypoxylon rubiginosum]